MNLLENDGSNLFVLDAIEKSLTSEELEIQLREGGVISVEVDINYLCSKIDDALFHIYFTDFQTHNKLKNSAETFLRLIYDQLKEREFESTLFGVPNGIDVSLLVYIFPKEFPTKDITPFIEDLKKKPIFPLAFGGEFFI